MSLLFFLYDFFVRQEFHEKKSVLEAKRKFVRFVSHEVRTPLNSVCMGLKLLKEELSGALRAKQRDSIEVKLPLTIAENDRVAGKSSLSPSRGSTGMRSGSVRNLSEHESFLMDLSDEVMANAESAVDVLNDLLNYDKIETGTLTLEMTVVPILELISRTSEEFQMPTLAKKIHLLFKQDCQDSPNNGTGADLETGFDRLPTLASEIRACQTLGDRVRLTQVFRNLLSNAVKFTPAEGSIYIRTSWLRPTKKNASQSGMEEFFTLSTGEEVQVSHNGHFQVQVTDTGVGMTKEQVDRLFRNGVQFNVNDLQSGQGSGLGLYIAKGIVEQHGGTLLAASDGLGKGTTFTVTLPLHQISIDDTLDPDCFPTDSVGEEYRGIQNQSANSALASREQAPHSLRVLIVDDVATNRKLLRRLLERRGHQCEEAENGLVAIELVEQALAEASCYDSILLDYEMPIMDGPAACRRIRTMGYHYCIVGITGNVLPDDVAHFKRAGANCVLPKPLQLCALERFWKENGVISMNVTSFGHYPDRMSEQGS
jgi:hypothetical protein